MKLSSNCQNYAPHTFPSVEHTVVKNIVETIPIYFKKIWKMACKVMT